MADEDIQFETLLEYLRRTRSFDFTGYKRASLKRRVGRRLQVLNLDTYESYIDYLEVHPDEFAILFNTILINVTGFFRDAPAWDYIKSEIVPRILDHKRYRQESIRIWSAGCASGEEAYTLAMIMAEALGLEQMQQRVKIFATDLDEEALNQARQGVYSGDTVATVPEPLLSQYFEQVDSHFCIHKDLRRCVIFGRHDLVQDAPISRIDLLTCRNTLMYFNADTQLRVLSRLHFALNAEESFLLLGKAEMLFSRTEWFVPVELRQRVFTKVPKVTPRDLLLAKDLEAETVDAPINYDPIQGLAFDVDPTPQIVLNANNLLILANAKARQLFSLTERDLNCSLADLPFSYRPIELRSHIDQLRTSLRTIDLNDLEWFNNGEITYLRVVLLPLVDADRRYLGVKIQFIDISEVKHLQDELYNSKQELETAYEELQSTNEELETTNEELQSTNEELETTNEELQSTNEELETMNEELQSANEELIAMNDELRDRSVELDQANAFLRSILGGLTMGVTVVDPDLKVIAWNHKAEDMWGLRADEVQGVHFFNLDIGLPVIELRDAIRACLNSNPNLTEELVLAATNRRGRAIQCQVKCSPLLGFEQSILGVILLMEEQLEES